MVKKLSLIIGLGLLLSACGASTPNVKTADVQDNKDKLSKCMRDNKDNKEDCVSKESVARTGLICKREAITGTRLAKRICKTAEQRRREAEASKDLVEHMQRRTFTSNSG